MKSQIKIQTKANRQNRQGIGYVLAGAFSTFIRIRQATATPNIFLVQNKGKGPPGRSRSPGTSNFPIPDYKPAAGNSSNKAYQVTQYQTFNFYYN